MVHSLSGHVQELLDELEYWSRDSSVRPTPNLTEDERLEFLMQERARRKVAAEGCRREIEEAVIILRQNGF